MCRISKDFAKTQQYPITKYYFVFLSFFMRRSEACLQQSPFLSLFQEITQALDHLIECD